MIEQEVEGLIQGVLPDSEIKVSSEGSNFQLNIVSEGFDKLSLLKRQQLVYSCINEKIKNGQIHAVTMQLFTQAEWEKHLKFSL